MAQANKMNQVDGKNIEKVNLWHSLCFLNIGMLSKIVYNISNFMNDYHGFLYFITLNHKNAIFTFLD